MVNKQLLKNPLCVDSVGEPHETEKFFPLVPL